MSELIHRVLIVPAAFQALAQGLCEAAEGDDSAGGDMTTLPAICCIFARQANTRFKH